MKKAFEQNVSRSKPRLRMGSALDSEQLHEDGEGAIAHEADEATREEASLTEAAEGTEPIEAVEEMARPIPFSRAQLPVAPVPDIEPMPEMLESAAVEVEPESPPQAKSDALTQAASRRDKLKERLRAVRENPRPEPLPPTVAEAGVRAVERISQLQSEVAKLKSLNSALAQDLDSARRQSERATEEARLRMDEAQRLSSEMEGRAKLLNELESELSSLEAERDESLLALQESRQQLELTEKEKQLLTLEIDRREKVLAETLSEEERLAGELEESKDEMSTLRRALEALTGERDTLARQVADLTRERAELMEARKALESVHRALSKAATR